MDVTRLGIFLEEQRGRLTRKEVSEISGLTEQQIYSIEKGERHWISMQSVFSLARALGIECLDLTQFDEEKKVNA